MRGGWNNPKANTGVALPPLFGLGVGSATPTAIGSDFDSDWFVGGLSNQSLTKKTSSDWSIGVAPNIFET
jgi:hypothetical protein